MIPLDSGWSGNIEMVLGPVPLTLYIHIPWCIKKCPYCDFNSHPIKQEVPEKAYIQALIHDLQQTLPMIWGRPIQSIFFGGGTPSVLSPDGYDTLLSQIRALLPMVANAEITLEANPSTFEMNKFKLFKACGINRLSIGVQSFNDHQLKKIGRVHTADEAKMAVVMAHEVGFKNINVDLMYGLPEQPIDQSLITLKQAVELQPQHISFYQMTIEANTFFASVPPKLPSDDQSWSMMKEGQEQLANDDYEQYEISAYAKKGHQCQHNLNYWQFGDYVGIGAGAHGKLTTEKGVVRTWKTKHPDQYMQQVMQASASYQKSLDELSLISEFLMNALRLHSGFSMALFEQTTGINFDRIEAKISQCVDIGLLEQEQDHIETSLLGKQFLNEIMMRFV